MGTAQRFFARTTVTALLALAASSAQAIPLTFAFTATVRETIISDEFGQTTVDPSHNGEAVIGAITIETEGLVRDTFTDEIGTELTFFEPAQLSLISSVLSIGGVLYDVGAYDNNFGSLRIIDSGGPVSCGPGCSFTVPDQVGVGDGSTNEPGIFDPNLTGTFDVRSLRISWHDPSDSFGLIDLSNPFEPLDVLNIPMGLITGSFSQQVETCEDGLCFISSDVNTVFEFGSLTVSAMQVPEPGTLGLVVLGLLGLGGVKKWRSGRDSNPRPPA